MIENVSSALKQQAKSLGLSQKAIAEEIGVSHPTVKRWFSGKGLDLENLMRLLRVLNLNLEELGAMIPATEKKTFRYSKGQEQFFSEFPEYLAFFDHLLKGYTPEKIAAKHSLNYRSMRRYLKKLTELQLIEVLEKDRVRLLVKGEPVWRKNGVLAQSLKAMAVDEFLDRCQVDLYLHHYIEEDKLRISQKIDDLVGLIQSANRRAKVSNSAQSYGFMIGFQKFRWKLLDTVVDL